MSNARVHAEHSSDRQCDSHAALHKAPSIFLQYKEWLKSTLSIWSGQNREKCVFFCCFPQLVSESHGWTWTKKIYKYDAKYCLMYYLVYF